MDFIELLGYLSSALVVFSMLMTSVVKLRIVNLLGNITSCSYALLIASYPVVIMNVCLMIINIYNLTKIFRPNKHFELIVCNPDDAFLSFFLKRWRDDIQIHFPEFDRKSVRANAAFLVCCNGVPAGVTIGNAEGKTLDIALDYSTPPFRDCSVAKYLHCRLPEKGVTSLFSSQSKTKQHIAFLNKMGFTEQNGVFVKQLSDA